MRTLKIKDLKINVEDNVGFRDLEDLNFHDVEIGAIYNKKVYSGGNSINDLEVLIYNETEVLKDLGIDIEPELLKSPSFSLYARVDEIIIYPKGKTSSNDNDGISFKMKGLRPFTIKPFHYLCGRKIDNANKCIKIVADFTGSLEYVIDGIYDPVNNTFDTTPDYRDKKHILACVYWSDDPTESRLSNVTHGFKNKDRLKEISLYLDRTYHNVFKHTGYDYVILTKKCVDHYDLFRRL